MGEGEGQSRLRREGLQAIILRKQLTTNQIPTRMDLTNLSTPERDSER